MALKESWYDTALSFRFAESFFFFEPLSTPWLLESDRKTLSQALALQYFPPTLCSTHIDQLSKTKKFNPLAR